MKKVRILGVLLTDRSDEATDVQEVLTKYGCNIKTRLGLHNNSENPCDEEGLIILELAGDSDEWKNLEKELKNIEGVKVDHMDFK